ncbi:MAG: phytoene desaturase family protein, partial [Nitrospinota bacterium]
MSETADAKYDAVVIGSGLGGLTAAALLAKRGKKVLLIEQSVMAGGCAVTFKRKQYKMEASLHEMDGFGLHDYKATILKELNLFDKVKFLKVPEFYRFIAKNNEFIFPNDLEEAIRLLIDKFPDEKDGILKFFKIVLAIRKEIHRIMPIYGWLQTLLMPFMPLIAPRVVFYTYTKQTVGHLLDSLIKNEDLKLILTANIAYYHDDPYHTSLLYFSAGQGGYYSLGGYFVQGGSSNLSDCMVNIIEKAGGLALLRTTVSKIIVENGAAIGVEYFHNKKRAEIKKVFAPNIIANGAIDNIAAMLPDVEKSKIKKLTNNLKLSTSFFNVYIGFKTALKELGSKHYSTIIDSADQKTMADITSEEESNPYDKCRFTFIDYSQIDSKLAPDGMSVGTITIADHISRWDSLTDEDYKRKKEEVAQILLKRLERVIPGICSAIDYYEVATPKTIQRYTMNPQGVVYGFAQIPEQIGLFRIKNRSPVKNLYFASS